MEARGPNELGGFRVVAGAGQSFGWHEALTNVGSTAWLAWSRAESSLSRPVLEARVEQLLELVVLRPPGVPHVITAGESDGWFYVAAQPQQGAPLYQRLGAGLSDLELASLAFDLVTTVQQLHDAGLSCGPIDLNSVLLGDGGRAQIPGYPLNVLSGENTDTKRLHEDPGPACDQCLIGLFLTEVLVRRRALRADTAFAIDVPTALRSIIYRMTMPDPSQRYPDLAQCAADLRRTIAPMVDGEAVAHLDLLGSKSLLLDAPASSLMARLRGVLAAHALPAPDASDALRLNEEITTSRNGLPDPMVPLEFEPTVRAPSGARNMLPATVREVPAAREPPPRVTRELPPFEFKRPLAFLDLGDPKVQLPEQLGPFHIKSRLGSGGMGVVLDATTASGQRVALKLIRPVGAPNRVEMLRARLLREARILGQLSHSGIVGVVDFGELENIVYLAMEHLEGVSLESVRRRTSFDLDALLSLGKQLSAALDHLHCAGIVHRDVKPGNVIVVEGGRAILADFGIARDSTSEPITRAGEVLGSIGYLAPECMSGPHSAASDQYSLGRLLFEMAALAPAKKPKADVPLLMQFEVMMSVDWDRFPSQPVWQPLRRILARMISARPEDRFPDMKEAQLALEALDRVLKHGSRPDTTLPSTVIFSPANTLNVFIERLHLDPRSPYQSSENLTDPSPVSVSISIDEGRLIEGSSILDMQLEAPVELAPPPAVKEPATIPPVEAPPPLPAPPPPPAVYLEPSAASLAAGNDHSAERINIPIAARREVVSPPMRKATVMPRDGVITRRPPVPVVAPRARGSGVLRKILSVIVLLLLLTIAAQAGERGFFRIVSNALGFTKEAALLYSDPLAPTDADRELAGRLLANAAERINAGARHSAEPLLGACIELAGLSECHHTLSTLLALRGHPSAQVHLTQALKPAVLPP